MRNWISIASLLLIVAACGPTNSEPPFSAAARDTNTEAGWSVSHVAWSDCRTHTLRLALNTGDASDKADILQALRVLARYPLLQFVPLESAEGSTFIQIRPSRGCADQTCALDQGWESVQTDLSVIKGAGLACDLFVRPVDKSRTTYCPSRWDQNPKQDVPDQEAKQGGGVGVGN